jgi:cytochrome c peroxidase
MSLPRLAPDFAPAAKTDLRIAGALVLLLTVEAASFAAAQSRAIQPRADQEPITAIPTAPAQDPRRVALGERLFADQRLSHNNARSCQSCHDTRTNGASANAHDVSPDGQPLALNTPTIFNAGLNLRLNWEGNFRSLESEVEEPITSPGTMASSVEEILGKLRVDRDMVKQFSRAYGREPDRATLLDAIVTYERSLTTPGGRFDRWLAGDSGAITAEELSGYQLFNSLGCISCHQGVNVGGNLFERSGIFHQLASGPPKVFRVPSLRNVAVTAPYFHDGSAATLPEAVRAMGFAQLDRVLTNEQVTAIVAFLNTLTGTYKGAPVTSAGIAPRAAAP